MATHSSTQIVNMGFPGHASDKQSACQGRSHLGSISGFGRIPSGGRAWQPTPVFLPRNPMDRGAWRTTGHSIEKNQTRLKRLSMHINIGGACIF